MLTVDFSKQLGYVIANDGRIYPFFECNGLLAVCPTYQGEDGQTRRYLHSFFDDKRHMTNMLGLTKLRDGSKSDCFKTMFGTGVNRVVLKREWEDRDMVAHAFLKAGYCVQFE